MNVLLNIRRAFENRIAAMTPALPFVAENTKYVPDAKTPYQRGALLLAPPDNSVIGSYYRDIGLYQLTLNYPLHGGPLDITQRAEAVRANFPRGTPLVENGTTVMVERTPTIGNIFTDKDFVRLPVSINFYVEVFT